MTAYDDEDRDWLTVAECARRMKLTQREVRALALGGILRAQRVYGELMVEPAIVAGVTTK
ncbi:hypothetical protein [Mycolicibacterium tokaiense]|uniref:DNA-binding protein n=1 Tax=Mycolicibacterium tokaiense TaxID=39695 RepID=A0A378THG5_9MYCO|nr:hypothetical protein [Mycolicibacterium tokaiense]BBY86498.1 hypothetical protein MTOK_22800 [Mycolicibacterium tokaiense]STZ58996.1 Uncharacterised protein [Mycolicibacterium tokaiense]